MANKYKNILNFTNGQINANKDNNEIISSSIDWGKINFMPWWVECRETGVVITCFEGI